MATTLVAAIVLSGSVMAQTTGVATVKYKANVTCQGCKSKIEKNMAYEKGVTAVDADIDADIVTVTYKLEQTSPDALSAALTKIGYSNEMVGAPATTTKDTADCHKACPKTGKACEKQCKKDKSACAKSCEKPCCKKTKDAGESK